MKYLILLSVMFLAGCDNAEHYGIVIGDIVTVKKGFYKGCIGVVTDYSHYDMSDDRATIREVTCRNVTSSFIIIRASEIGKQ